MAEVAITEKLVAEISEKSKESGAEAEAKDDVLPSEAGGKTLAFGFTVFRFFSLKIAKGPHRVNRQRAP